MPRGIYNRNKSNRRRTTTGSQAPPTDEQLMEHKALSALTSAAMNAGVEKVRMNKRLDHIEALVTAKMEEFRKPQPILGEGTLSSLAARNYLLTGSIGDAKSVIENAGKLTGPAASQTNDSTIGTLILSIERIAYERGLTEGRLNAKILDLSIQNQELLVTVRTYEEEQANAQAVEDLESC